MSTIRDILNNINTNSTNGNYCVIDIYDDKFAIDFSKTCDEKILTHNNTLYKANFENNIESNKPNDID